MSKNIVVCLDGTWNDKMARPLRPEFSGAPYHVTSPGNRKEAVYEQDFDRESFLTKKPDVCEQYNWVLCILFNG